MPATSPASCDAPFSRRDALALTGLVMFATLLVATSWRKWPDAQIDFGRELYLPWRVAEGAVFGRDIESLYGPLSVYVNGAWFAVFGASIGSLVALNLLLYAVILFVLYESLRRGWGTLGAATGSAFFVAVFSFSQLVGVGNYNFVTPYSHEATHGFLACLVAALSLLLWRRRGGALFAGLAGLAIGCAALLKIECLVAALGLAAATAALHLRSGARFLPRDVVAFASSAVLPLAAFTVYFWPHLGASEALVTAGQTIFNAFATSRYTTERVQFEFSGFDRPTDNLLAHALAVGAIAGAVTLKLVGVRSLQKHWEQLSVDSFWQLTALLALGVAAAGWYWGADNFGRALFFGSLVIAALAAVAWEQARREGAPRAESEARLVLALLGAALMLRMLLNGRLHHYGFYQAAVAGAIAVAALNVELPRLVEAGRGRWLLQCLVAAFVLGIAGQAIFASQRIYQLKTLALSDGADRTWHLPAVINGRGEIKRAALEWARKNVAPGDKLLVLPEGVMLNFLMRRETPLRTTHFFAGALSEGREAKLVEQLDATPPKWVILLSRDLREYGVARYGEKPGHGQLLIEWVQRRYTQVATSGADPLDPDKVGIRAFQLRSP